MSAPLAKLFAFHITHVDNLPGILREGALLSDAEMLRRRQGHQSIAHDHIKERRLRKTVTCPPGGKVGDYVPFYFGRRSPMLYAIDRGAVEAYKGQQLSIVYLIVRVQDVVNAGLPYVFTDGNAATGYSLFFNDLSQLDNLNWTSIEAVYWNDTDETPDRKREKQAEFLLRDRCPWSFIEGVAVADQRALAQVQQHLAGQAHQPEVQVCRSWYY